MMKANPLTDDKAKGRLAQISRKVRPKGTLCPVPKMCVVQGELRLEPCARTSVIGCCLKGQGAPFGSCASYVLKHCDDVAVQQYFTDVETLTDMDFLEAQRTFGATLFQHMLKDHTLAQEAKTRKEAMRLAEATADSMNAIQLSSSKLLPTF